MYLKIAVRIILQWLNKGEQENANGILGEADFIQSHKKISTAGARRGATQIFDLIRGTYVKTVAEQSTLLRCECDALQLTAGEEGVA